MKNNSIALFWLLLVSILLLPLISGCATWYGYACVEFPNADGAGLPDEEIGYLDFGEINISVHIDDIQVRPGGKWEKGEYISLYGLREEETACFARLKPGSHIIRTNDRYGENRPVDATLIIDVEAGHRYKIHTDGCYTCKEWRAAVWIKDQDTGKIVTGTPPDWWLW